MTWQIWIKFLRRFLFEDSKTYNAKDAELWCTIGQSGLDKRQCTMQLMIFADGSTLILNSSYLKEKIYGEEQKKRNNETKELLSYFEKNMVL